MQTHDLKQGSAEWHAFRAKHFNASDAPAMMGCSPYKTRDDLLKDLATGLFPEHASVTLQRFEEGHRAEALARPMAEEIVGEELYPVVGSNGKLAASFDGLTMLEDILFEHKSLNDSIRAALIIDELPRHYKIQMQHQQMVSGAKKTLFMATKWNGDECIEEVHFWYEYDQELADQITNGWAQFEKDLAAYVYEPPAVEAEGETPASLPALRIEISGQVAASNLAEFKASAMTVLSNIKTVLITDEDFATAEKTTKWCKDVEERIDAAKQHALSQTSSIEELLRALDAIKEEARQKRLTLEKLVKSQKEIVKITKIEAAKREFYSFASDLQKEIVGVTFHAPIPDFSGVIKGLKTLSSMQSAINNEMAKCKIEADKLAKELRVKLSQYAARSKGYESLFPDLQSIISKNEEDFCLLIDHRIEQRKKAEAERIERETARIRAEEEVKARAKVAAEERAKAQAKAEEEAKVAAEERAKAQAKAEEEAKVAAEERAKAQAKAEEEAKVAAEERAKAQAKAEEEAKARAKIEAEDHDQHGNVLSVVSSAEEISPPENLHFELCAIARRLKEERPELLARAVNYCQRLFES